MFKIKIVSLIRHLKQLFSEKPEKLKHQNFEHVRFSYDNLVSLDKKIECNESVQELFDSISEGDLIYAHMPLSEEKLQQIPEGHRTRPYYVAYKLNYGFIAYASSSSLSPRLVDHKSYALSDFTYEELKKSSYLDLENAYYLPKDKLIRFICETTDKDFNEIQRRLWIGKREEYERLFKRKPVISYPIPGDVINSRTSQWIILSEIGNYYRANEISKNNKKDFKNGIFVHCNYEVWKVNLDSEILIKKKPSIKTQHIVNYSDFSSLKKIVQKKKGSWSNLPKGVIFESNDELYYCYNSDNDHIDAFRTYQAVKDEDFSSFVRIEADDIAYYVDIRKSVKIGDTSCIKNPIHVTSRYVNLINYLRNSPQEKKKSRKYFMRAKMGTIFKDIEENEEYVYLFSNRSYDYCIKVSEYLDSELYPEYSLYELEIRDLVKNGEVCDDELRQVLIDQIEYGNEREGILRNKLQELVVAK